MIETIKLPGFASGSYRSEAIYADVQRCVNFYPEIVESGVGENSMVLYSTPGTRRFGSAPGTDIGSARGMIELNGQIFFVTGSKFTELMADGSFVVRGAVRAAASPVSMAANNVGQIFICSAGDGYCYGVPEQVHGATPVGFLPIVNDGINFFGASQVAFLDDFFVVLTPKSSQIQVSNINDGTVWNGVSGINIALVQGQADHLVGILSDKENLYLVGSRRAELWQNIGASFPFAINPGAFIETGTVAPFSLVQADNGVFWLGQDSRGACVFYRFDGIRETRVSTFAEEWVWQSYGNPSDAVAFSYQQNGHTFVVLTFVTGDATWVYDCSTKLWHERTYTDVNSNPHAWVGLFHVFGFGQHLVLSSQAVPGENQGQIYTLSTTTYADLVDDAHPNGTVIIRDRITPHIYAEDKRYFCNKVELRAMTGVGLDGSPPLGVGVLPQVMMRVSRDGGQTFGAENWVTAGAIGNYTQRIIWNLPGAWRDGVLWFRCTDPVNWVLIDCYLTGELGAN